MRYMLKCKCGSVEFDTREMATDSRAYTCQRCGAFEFYDVLDDIKLVPTTLVVDAIEVAATPKAVSYDATTQDYYRVKAAELFGITYDEVTDVQRSVAKGHMLKETYSSVQSIGDEYVDFSTSDGTCTLGGNWARCHRDCNKCELYQDYLANKEED